MTRGNQRIVVEVEGVTSFLVLASQRKNNNQQQQQQQK